MKHFYLFIIALFYFSACQYPLGDIERAGKKTYLQFEVEVTPFYARAVVTETSDEISGNYRSERPVPVSALYITDSGGKRTNLKNNGLQDTSFQGRVGETYVLHASVNGKEYESQPEVLRPAPALDSVWYAFSTRDYLTDKNVLKHGFDVFARFKDFEAPGNYYQWTWVNYTQRYRCGTRQRFGTILNLACDQPCWEINYGNNIILFTDAGTNGETQNISLTRVPFEKPPERYYLLIEQRAIGKNVYRYLFSAKEQTEQTGGQFDVPGQTQFSTNIVCKTDPGEKVLGVFNVFGLQKKVIYVDRRVVIPGVEIKVDGESLRPLYQCAPPFPPPCMLPCEESVFVTTRKPEGWVE